MLGILSIILFPWQGLSGIGMVANLPADTIVVAVSSKLYTFDKERDYCVIPLHVEHSGQWKKNEKYRLFFDELTAEALPEGVYEGYLLPGIPDKKKTLRTLGTDQPSYVGLLNLYNLNAPGKPRGLSINATRAVHQLLSVSAKPPSQPCLVLYFRGNEMPDKKTMPHTGRLLIGKIRLVRLNEG